MKFQIFTGKDQQVYFHIRGDNGEILTHSGTAGNKAPRTPLKQLKKRPHRRISSMRPEFAPEVSL